MAEGGVNWKQRYFRSKLMQIVMGGLIIKWGVMSSEYGISPQNKLATYQPRQHIFLQKKKKTSSDHHTHNVKQQF